MKRLLCLITCLFICVVGISTVKAEDAYDVYIDVDGNMVVKDSSDDSVISDTTNIATYSNNVLTLMEGLYYDYIEIYHDTTITTNNKKVYLENFKAEGTADNKKNIVFNKVNIKAYNDGIKDHGYQQFYMFRVKPELKDTVLDLYSDDTNSIQFWLNTYDDNLGGIFKNFEVKTSRFFVNGTNSSLNDSKIYADSFEFFDNGSGTTFDNVLIKVETNFQITGNSTYNYLTRLSTIKNSTIIIGEKKKTTNKSIYFTDASYTIENSTIKSYIGSIFGWGNITYKNCEIDSYGSVTGFDLVIEDCNVTAGDEIDGSTSLLIKNSNVKHTTEHASFPYICATNSVDIINSTVISDGSIYTASIANGTVNVENSNLKIRSISSGKSITFKDSVVIVNNVNANNNYTYYSAISSRGEFNIYNSRVIAQTDGDAPAIVSLTGFTFQNDNETFIYNDSRRLTVATYTASEENIMPDDTTTRVCIEKVCVNRGETIYTTTLNNIPTKYAETYGYYEVKVRIVNGTIDDNTEKTYNLLLDEEFVYPTNMKANSGYEGGSWEKTGENEYTYTFTKIPKNPKTGIFNLIGLLEISIILLVLFICNKDKLTIFKRI